MFVILPNEVLMGREVKDPLTPAQWANLADLMARINVIRVHYGKPLRVSSGYRPAAQNQAIGGAAQSSHMTCQAVDFSDPSGDFSRWCLANMDLLNKTGLYLEDPRWTRIKDSNGQITGGWTHLSSRPTKSNPFVPNSNPPIDPNFKI
jgi:hypothetical protein